MREKIEERHKEISHIQNTIWAMYKDFLSDHDMTAYNRKMGDEPRECDDVVLWAQIGIFENMLFWKEDMTYQFCVPFDSEKKLMKEYEKHKKEILDDTYCAVNILNEEKPMRRLYWSNHGLYADAEYVSTNG